MEIKSFPLFSKWSLKNQNSADWGWGKMRTIPFFWIIGALPVSIFLVFWCSVWFATSWLGLNKWTQLDSFLTMIVFGGHKSIGGWKTNWGKIYVLSITLWLYITFWWEKTTKKQAVWVKALLQKFLKYPSWYSQNIREISVFCEKCVEAQRSKSIAFQHAFESQERRLFWLRCLHFCCGTVF